LPLPAYHIGRALAKSEPAACVCRRAADAATAHDRAEL